jgi:hypothetical protein
MENFQENIGNANLSTEALTLTYAGSGYMVALIFRLLGIFIGFFLSVLDEILITGIGYLLLFLFLTSFIDILLFQEMELNDNTFTKRWYLFGSKQISVDSLNLARANNSYFNGGTVAFWRRGHRLMDIFLFKLDLLALGQANTQKLKQKLINLNLIKGNEHGWND